MEKYDYINIHAQKQQQGCFNISSKSQFLRTPVIVKKSDDKIVFTKPSLGYVGKIHSPSHDKYGWHRIGGAITGDVPLGKYYFDQDDSTEDIKVCYFDPNY